MSRAAPDSGSCEGKKLHNFHNCFGVRDGNQSHEVLVLRVALALLFPTLGLVSDVE